MSRERRPLGPPYSDEEVAEELIAEGTFNLTPQDVELAEFIAGRLPDWHQADVERRVEEDDQYRAWAAPLLALRELRPRRVDDISRNDVLSLERAIAGGLAGGAGGPPPEELARRRRVVRGMLWRWLLMFGLLMAIPIMLVLNRSRWLGPDTANQRPVPASTPRPVR
ncbi:MAG: hypothetical protein IPK85_13805 [Gemmatimonadetes bacterium]|nr:hypothetical protein [Gemmatimonadota bacterium]